MRVPLNAVLLVVFVLASLIVAFAKQLCEFNARYVAGMPDWMQRLNRWRYLGRSPDDPLWITTTRIGGILLAILSAAMYVRTHGF